MKVKDLIKLLEEHNPEAEVGFSHPSHDYWKTQLVGVVKEAEEAEVIISEYHQAWRLADERTWQAEGCEKDTMTMVVLNG
jgi:hypothetical protein